MSYSPNYHPHPDASVNTQHHARIIERLGVSEIEPGSAVLLVAVFQYIFLIRLWLGYPIRYVDDVIHLNIVIVGVVLSISGIPAIVWFSVNRWIRGTEAAKRLEKGSEHPSFHAIHITLNTTTAGCP